MWTEPILHVDMDAFFVEVERRRRPELIGRPVAVGGTGARGVVASASYEARRFGVESAQPTAIALRRCPDLLVVPPTHGLYGEVSIEVFELLRSFTPLVEGLSVDEAFLDVAGLRRHHESPVSVAREIRQRIRSELALPCSVGIASNKLVSKLASQAAKPDGIRHVPGEGQLEFLHPLPVENLWGVGPATLVSLRRLGIRTVGDLAETPEATLSDVLGPTVGAHLTQLANGVDNRPVEPDSQAKSVSVEETYEEDLVGHEVVETALLAHAQRLSVRLRRSGLVGKTVNVKIRYGDFTTTTRSRTLPDPISSSRELFAAARVLLDRLDPFRGVRLLGLGVSSLAQGDGPRQARLALDEGRDRLDQAIARVQDRYGMDAIAPARLAQRPTEEWEGDT